ncbi:MAG TPA: EthD domain-containing protein [Roseiarcus sp.]|nr:EthD domain-containing protein [Roseiarcus sp.]
MIRRVSFIRRRAGLSREEFFAHWTGRHAEIVRQLPGLRGLRFSRVERCVPDDAAWDGVGETWFDSIADADRAFSTEPFLALLSEDRPKFIGGAHSCYIEESPSVEPPGPWRAQ